MKSIPDETPISAISIPGSHKSLSLHICQVWPLDQQLKVGLRYLDVHAGFKFLTDKDVIIRDGNWKLSQRITIDDVLKKIVKFLNDNKSETVLLKLTIGGVYMSTAEQYIKELIREYQSKMWTELSVPNMKQARGKIVFLQSDTFRKGPKTRKSSFFEGDKLNNIEAKIMKSHFCNDHIVLTDTAESKNPKSLARTLNKKFNNFVEQHKKNPKNKGCLGVLSFNFPSAEMIKNIIQLNPCSCGPGSGSPTSEAGPTTSKPETPTWNMNGLH
ncbi:1-phosphatidylinositol phosphodiesterase-like [Scomber japonicus]|uniref:1-phosphatidylinositol phosphodiesterase-like n=1 Tax=Scomber japonicus TaxID=13676 RepID=UPI002306BE42|nr:1-phosphatidylinositol phosphodiesterase-like [Scomber japonicus]